MCPLPDEIHGCAHGGDEDKAKLLYMCGACRWGKLGVVKEVVEQHEVRPQLRVSV